ncbi:4-hydroxy-tetrahydrodipicolinate synthase [Qiania dongpingensis]|uniref:4-hydroxy-tetrahydrodipicolinate synthase n=1 Tax=Qiania dongpingensis TaxID=2763669 RepID=A0A7G9G1A1_9FIRM|nr:4-hydroxy-tetrahydrodipicolinate synthase [Qiania dongpingensis]QNM04583.1 4-hydroxy-tetrahydrodipicolinate synthase [Qiania dongpingensis]
MNSVVKKYGRILLPLITPYDENEEIDYGKYAELIDYVIEKDVCDSLIVTGTTGEASLLTFDERVKLFETAVKAAAGRKPVIAGTGCASTKETIALTKKAEELGIGLCLIVCPFYNKPTQEGVYEHYRRIAESTKADILLYNIPIFVGINLEPATVGRLAAIENIVGVKDEAGVNPTQVTDFFLATKDIDSDFAIYNGDDVMLLPTIVQGAMGIVSGGAHIYGHEIRAIFDAFENGENEKAKELFMPMYEFCKSTGQNGRILPNSILRPAIEAVTGVKLGPARGPLAPAIKAEMDVTLSILKKQGKL